MSHETSPSTQQPYGIARVTRVWQVPRSTVYARRDRRDHPSPAAKRGPKTPWTDAVLTAHIRTIIAESPFHGEGHRKIWARLRAQGLRTSKRRTLVVMRAADLLGPTRLPTPVVARPHDGTIVTTSPNVMWGTDATATVTLADGQVTIFGAIDHCTAECVGLHAAKYGTRFEALEPVRQGRAGSLRGNGHRRGDRAHDAPRPRQSVHERRLSRRAPVPRHRVVAGLRPPAGRQRVHRTVLPHPQGTAAVGAALHGCRGPAAGPAHLQGDL